MSSKIIFEVTNDEGNVGRPRLKYVYRVAARGLISWNFNGMCHEQVATSSLLRS